MYLVSFHPCCRAVTAPLSSSCIYSRQTVVIVLEMKNTFLVREVHKTKFDPQNLLKACFCVFQVIARDDDQGANGQLSYMLSGGNDESAFSLSSSGQLSLTQTLDREAQGKYTLLITATDSGKTAVEVWSCEGV